MDQSPQEGADEHHGWLSLLGCNLLPVPIELCDNLDDVQLPAEVVEAATPRHGNGCDDCMGTGYRGRMAVHEILRVDNRLRELIRRSEPVDMIVKAAEQNGLTSLFKAGALRALRGETTMAEVRRVLSDAR